MAPETSIVVISTLYSFTGIIRIVSYTTQFCALWRDHSGAASTSLITWAGFLTVWAIGAAYGWIVIDDGPVVFVSACGVLGSAMILGLAVWRRYGRGQGHGQGDAGR